MSVKLLINQTELTEIICNIFRGVVTSRLEKTFNDIYDGQTNQCSHRERIEEIDESAKQTHKTKILSVVSIAKRPMIDIYVQVSVLESGETKYGIFGSDLRKYHMYLPKIHDRITGRTHRPQIGVRHSRWYPHFMASVMKNISLHLRMLDLYLKNNGILITLDYTASLTGVLGLEVPIDIPEPYSGMFDEEVECDSNPIKKCPGIFVFGKNGVSHENSNLMAEAASKVAGFEHIYPINIKEPKDITQFITSEQTIAIGVWNRHARILVKQRDKSKIEILDPWKRHIETDILVQFTDCAKICGWKVVFVSRGIKDQASGEGSCVLVAFARVLFLASVGTTSYNVKYYNEVIPDFFAFLSSCLYRKIR